MKTEIELKFYPVDKDYIRKKLLDAGFNLFHSEFLQTRATFDFSGNPDIWGRVRKEVDRITMTIKHHSPEMKYANESEVEINSFDDGVDFMTAAGFVKKSHQENLREKWVSGNVEVCIDTWPGIAPYIEIESDTEEAVKKVAEDLGLSPERGFPGGVFDLCEKVTGIPVCDLLHISEITFEKPIKKVL